MEEGKGRGECVKVVRCSKGQHTLCLGEHAVDGAGAAAAAHGDVVLEFLRHVEVVLMCLFV